MEFSGLPGPNPIMVVVLMVLFTVAGLVAWRRDYPQAAAILFGFAVLALARALLYRMYSG